MSETNFVKPSMDLQKQLQEQLGRCAQLSGKSNTSIFRTIGKDHKLLARMEEGSFTMKVFDEVMEALHKYELQLMEENKAA